MPATPKFPRDIVVPENIPEPLPAQILFGYSLDVTLYGILLIQTYLYWLAFPKDRRILKTVVHTNLLVNTIQMVFGLRDLHALFCTTGGNEYISNLLDPHNFGFMFITIPVSGAIVALLVQLTYAHRIFADCQNRPLPVIITMLSFSQFVIGIYVATSMYRPHAQPLPTNSMLNSPIITDALIWGILGAVCNVLIASYMIHFLWKQFKDISPESQACFTRANRFLLETGLLTALLSIAYVITSTEQWPYWFAIPGLSLSKIYGTSLLVMLNNRMAILDGRNRGDPAFEIPSFGRSRDSNTSGMISEIVFARNRRSVTARFQLSTVVRFTNTDSESEISEEPTTSFGEENVKKLQRQDAQTQ